MIINRGEVKEYLDKKEKSKEEMAKEFVKEFNQNAGNSRWIAEYKKCFHKDEPFTLLFLRKMWGWWIFKCMVEELQVGCYHNYYSFVDNDYVFTEYGRKKSDKFFKLLPEIKGILEKMDLPVFIMDKGERGKFEERVNKIKNKIREIENGKD